jgi:hypothetical protein
VLARVATHEEPVGGFTAAVGAVITKDAVQSPHPACRSYLGVDGYGQMSCRVPVRPAAHGCTWWCRGVSCSAFRAVRAGRRKPTAIRTPRPGAYYWRCPAGLRCRARPSRSNAPSTPPVRGRDGRAPLPWRLGRRRRWPTGSRGSPRREYARAPSGWGVCRLRCVATVAARSRHRRRPGLRCDRHRRRAGNTWSVMSTSSPGDGSYVSIRVLPSSIHHPHRW